MCSKSATRLATGPRLRYPLGYWNANGAMFGMAIALLLWMSRRAGWTALRWLSVAAMPAVLLALYFTYSRGGLLSLLVAVGALLVLSRDRLWMLGTLAAGAIGALPAVLAVQSRGSLANNVASQTSVDQGAVVLLFLLGGIALSLLAFAALQRVERRGGRATGRALELSQNPSLLKGIALAVAVVAIGVAVAVGGRAWDQFSNPDVQFPNQPAQHFTQLSGAGRYDFWRVAIDAFGDDPVLGQGAGTYQFSWNQHRSIDLAVHDAHSLYLEAFAELGIAGGLLVLALVAALLWVGFSAWRAAPHPASERYAALFAAMLAFAVGAAFDWFWEIAALGAVFFLAAGVLVGGAMRATRVRRPERGRTRGQAWLRAGDHGARAGLDIRDRAGRPAAGRPRDQGQPGARPRPGTSPARSTTPTRPARSSPSPPPRTSSSGCSPSFRATTRRRRERLTQAIDREDLNWQLYYLRSKVEHEAGEGAAARADLERARQLNPRETCLRGGWNCG